MASDGTVERMKPSEIGENGFASTLAVWHRSTAPVYIGKDIKDAISGHVLAKDRQHAIKIFNEYRTMAIAEGRLTW